MDTVNPAGLNKQSSFVIQLANLTVEVTGTSLRSRILCKDYLSEGTPDFSVSISGEDIKKEAAEINSFSKVFNKTIKIVSNTGEIKGFVNLNNDYYLEAAAIYRRIAEKALNYNTFLMHGAVLAIDDAAFMFTAPSGTGKTTHILQWIEKVKNSYILNGDKPLIRITNHEAIACGTPWCGNEKLGKNAMTPLKAIVLMERDEENSIQSISFPKAYPYLLGQTYIPEEPDMAKQALNLLAQLYGKVSFYRFNFNNFKDDCFDVAYHVLVGKSI